MKFVDVVRPGSLSQIIGPTGTLKRIINSKNIFLEKGYDINIFTYDSLFTGKTNIINRLQGGTVGRKSIVSSLKRYVRANVYKSRIVSLLFLKRSRHGVEKLVDYYLSLEREPYCVVFHSVYECYLYLINRKNTSAKTVCFFHSDGIPLKMEEIYYPKLIGSNIFKTMLSQERYVIENVDKCVFISEIGRNNFLSYYKDFLPSKTALMLNGINDYTPIERSFIERYTGSNSPFKYRLCCVGTINTRKGHRIIIEALKRISRDVLENIHITFIGDGPERVLLEDEVSSSNLQLHVEFTGAVDNSDVYKYLLDANIYILMSKNEGLPISIIEALRAGLPVIASNIAGIPELVSENNGVLIEPDVNQLVEVLNNIEQYNWDSMGEISRERFLGEFTFDRMRNEYISLLNSLS